jgi:hypothetical protein
MTPIPFDPTDKTPAELEQRRREIILSLTTTYSGYDDPDVPLELLQQLAIITSTLRRKNAGPPRTKRQTNGKAKLTIDDLDF